MSKLTIREQIMNFVESKVSASFTEIQKFVVDLKMGEGTYDKAKHTDTTWDKKTQSLSKCNPWRGYYCSAFTVKSSWARSGMLMFGKKS